MKLQYTDIDSIRLRASAGSHIGACIREAVALAFTENQDVILNHNDKNYLVDVSEIALHVENSIIMSKAK